MFKCMIAAFLPLLAAVAADDAETAKWQAAIDTAAGAGGGFFTLPATVNNVEIESITK